MHYLGAAAAVLAPLIVIVVLHQSRYCPQPRRRLRRTVYLAVLTTGLSTIVSTLLLQAMTGGAQSLSVVGAAAVRLLPLLALLEELSRFVVLAGYSLRPRAEPRATDGLCYGFAAGLTFALLESAMTAGGPAEAAAAAGWLRIALATPLHGLLGALMGHMIAQAYAGTPIQWGRLALALVLPALLHVVYDAPVVLVVAGGVEGVTVARAATAFAVSLAVDLVLAVVVFRLFRRALAR